MQQPLRHRQILPRQLLKLALALADRSGDWRAVALVFARTAARHDRNNGRSGMPPRSPRVGQVAVPDGVGMSRKLAPPQIHQQERQVVEHVDAGNLVVELDRVEQRRAAVEQDDVAQVEIAVALPDEATVTSRVEQATMPLEVLARAPR